MDVKRSGFLLIEILVGCVIMCTLLMFTFHGRYSRSWSTVENEFDRCFTSARFQSSLTGRQFDVYTKNEAIYVNRIEIPLPSEWKKMIGHRELRYTHMRSQVERYLFLIRKQRIVNDLFFK